MMELSKKEENHKKIHWLNRYRAAIREEQIIEGEIKKLRESKMSPSVSLSGMPHGSGQNDLSSYAATLDEQIRMLQEWKQEKAKVYEDILSRIRRVEDDNQRALLMYRYIQGMRWEEVAAKMGYTWRWTHKLHSKALDTIEIKEDIERQR